LNGLNIVDSLKAEYAQTSRGIISFFRRPDFIGLCEMQQDPLWP